MGQLFGSYGPYVQTITKFGHFERYFSDNCLVLPFVAKLSAVQLGHLQTGCTLHNSHTL